MAANNDVKENEITQASAQATLANLKEIRVVTTDGSSKAYGKADFMAVIAAGIKSYFSSIAANNIAGILTADSGKAGISALADVAQVLGGTPSYDYSLGAGESKDVFSWPSSGVRGGLYLVTEVTGRGYFSLYLLGKNSVTLVKTSSDANNPYLVITSDLQKVTLTNNDSLALGGLIYAIAYR